ncbi:hypothetical protein EHI7A_093060 [Entamoeba histolytica HM-1:IMSS-A]|uniref:Uncharacterized protein n=1 Tax=Entamoeba histolytica HM-1:IMSS-A TaxID=885318 RepID=N9V6R0_ENTH1|nr:hypothetical protein EHI7A_093060 [Entamoeba histolytica HM-1:IMSS-A]
MKRNITVNDKMNEITVLYSSISYKYLCIFKYEKNNKVKLNNRIEKDMMDKIDNSNKINEMSLNYNNKNSIEVNLDNQIFCICNTLTNNTLDQIELHIIKKIQEVNIN